MMLPRDEKKFWISLVLMLASGAAIIRGIFVLFSNEPVNNEVSATVLGFLFYGIVFVISFRFFMRVVKQYYKQPIENFFSSNLETLSYSGSGAIAEKLESVFESDPRALNISCNTGYHYTTGESSGNSEECAKEGQPEVGYFTMQYNSKDEQAIKEIYRRITNSKDD
jgi:hypothetical protein